LKREERERHGVTSMKKTEEKPFQDSTVCCSVLCSVFVKDLHSHVRPEARAERAGVLYWFVTGLVPEISSTVIAIKKKEETLLRFEGEVKHRPQLIM